MKLSINTNQLQSLVTKAIKGASNNKIFPMTCLMAIDYDFDTDKSFGKLSLTTTDLTNYLTVSLDEVSACTDELHLVVYAENFAKLISKMTSENVTLEFDGEFFTVSGGKSSYKIELPLDVDGTFVKMSVPEIDESKAIIKTIKLSSIKNILATAKTSLATTLDTPCYTAYYIGDNILSSNGYKICCIKEKLLDTPVLLGSVTMDLLDLAESDLNCALAKDSLVEDAIQFSTADGNYILRTKVYDGIESYSVDAITQLAESEFEASVVLNKNDMLQALDRLSVFVGEYDRNVIFMHFGEDGLTLTNKAKAGTEQIDYVSKSGNLVFDCPIEIDMLTSQIKAQQNDDFRLYYGLPNCIKIADDNIVQIIALFVEA